MRHSDIATKPLPSCPAWCQEHTHEQLDDESRVEGRHPREFWDQHYALLSKHDWPVYVGNGPNGVRTFSIEQSGFDEQYWEPTAVLTLFPDMPAQCARQSMNVAQLRELVAAMEKAIEIIEGVV